MERTRIPEASCRPLGGKASTGGHSKFSVAFLILAAAFALPAHAETLAYQAANRWVAQPDAAPLRALLAQAKQGKTQFTVQLPEDRALATERLLVVRDLLEKAAGTGVTLSENQGGPTAAPNTLVIEAR